MKKTLSFWQIAGFLFTSIVGVILHFLFEWTGENAFVASFSAVNESTWEHMKLLFFPVFVFALVESRYVEQEYSSFLCVKLIGILAGVVLIPVLYYLLGGVFGKTPDWVNIAIFYVSAAGSYLLETWILKRNRVPCKSPGKALFILWLIALLFVVLTFLPLRIPLFEDPITKTYGYQNII